MNLSRRNWLAATAAGGVAAAAATARAASFGNPDEPPQGAINAKNPASLTDPGPQNPAIASQFPGAGSPLATDIGDMPLYWATFNNAPRRTQTAAGQDKSRRPTFTSPSRSQASICGSHPGDCGRCTGTSRPSGPT